MQKWVPPEIERVRMERTYAGRFLAGVCIVMGGVLVVIGGFVGDLIGSLVIIIGGVVILIGFILLGKYEYARYRARSSLQKAPSDIKVCAHCKRPIFTDAEFCEYCGTRIQ